MFGWRWEQGGPWDSQGIEGVVRWFNRARHLVLEPPSGKAAQDQVTERAVVPSTLRSRA